MSDTPRTDEFCRKNGGCWRPRESNLIAEMKKIEREITAANERAERWMGVAERMGGVISSVHDVMPSVESREILKDLAKLREREVR